MTYYDYEDYYEPSEFEEKIEELKDCLKNSIKQETKTQIGFLKESNTRLEEENRQLKEKNEALVATNTALISDDSFAKTIRKNITQENVYKLIEAIFNKTFNENTYECSDLWGTYVNYYDDRCDVFNLLKGVGIDIPAEMENVILPHEWDEVMLDKFFDTMNRHYNCNACFYEDNLRFWSYEMAANPFPKKFYAGYDEIPWQFVLKNPLLNSEKYAIKIAEEMNKGGNGRRFSKICEYQTLDENVLQLIINTLKIFQGTIDDEVAGFLIDNIQMVQDENVLEILYSILVKQWNPDKIILKMPQKFQIRYAKSISSIEKKVNFLNKTNLNKQEKSLIIGDILKDEI